MKIGCNWFVNFLHVNGRSLCIVDPRMVVVEGGCPSPCKKGGGIVPGELSGNVSGEYVQGECLDPLGTRNSHLDFGGNMD